MTVIVAILMAMIAVAIVAWPIMQGGRARPSAASEADLAWGEMQARREAALTAIKDLEFDYRVGKVEEADYQALDAQLRAEAIAILKEIDRRSGAKSGRGDAQIEREIAQQRRKSAAAGRSLEAEVEAEIAALRRKSAPAAQPAGKREVAPAAVGNAAEPAFCTQCGAPIAAEDRFCRKCGTPVAGIQAA
jgi:hypothetical protein